MSEIFKNVEPTTNQMAKRGNRGIIGLGCTIVTFMLMLLTVDCEEGTQEITYSDIPVAAVQKGEKCGFIYKTGKAITSFIYEIRTDARYTHEEYLKHIPLFSNGFSLVYRDGKYEKLKSFVNSFLCVNNLIVTKNKRL